jgi:hypothetical protein
LRKNARFEQQPDSGRLELGRRKLQIADQGIAHPQRIDILWCNAGQAIELPALQRPRVLDRLADARLKFPGAIG